MPSHLAVPLSHCIVLPIFAQAELHSSTAVRTDAVAELRNSVAEHLLALHTEAVAVLCSPVPWRSTPLPLQFIAVLCRRNARPRNTLPPLRVVHQSNAAAILPFAPAVLLRAFAVPCFSVQSSCHAYLGKAVAFRFGALPRRFPAGLRRRNSEHSRRASVPSHSMLLQNCSFLCRCFAAHGVAPPLPGVPLLSSREASQLCCISGRLYTAIFDRPP